MAEKEAKKFLFAKLRIFSESTNYFSFLLITADINCDMSINLNDKLPCSFYFHCINPFILTKK